MESNKLFLTINRINSILFLLLLIFSLFGSYFIFKEINRSSTRNTVEVAIPNKDNKDKETIELSGVVRVSGREQQYIKVYSRKDGLLKSGGYSRTLRNLLFLSPESGEPSWLLPKNDSVIIHARELKKYTDDESITEYFYLEVADKDVNDDGIISNLDGIKIGISNSSGQHLEFIEEDITKVIEFEYFENNKTLGVLVQIGSELRYRVYDLKKLKRTSDKFVIKLD